MTGLNASEIRVAGTGRVLVADVGSPAPADFKDDWASPPWVDLGYTTSDGVKFTKKDKLDPVDTWQTVASIRFVYSDRDFSVKFVLLQVNAETLRFFFGGGAVTTSGSGLSYDIAAAPQVNERALAIQFQDGESVTHRFLIPRGVVTETDEAAFSRNSAVKLGVTFTALTPLDSGAKALATWSMNSTTPATSAAKSAGKE
jgi:hypothetical protein